MLGAFVFIQHTHLIPSAIDEWKELPLCMVPQEEITGEKPLSPQGSSFRQSTVQASVLFQYFSMCICVHVWTWCMEVGVTIVCKPCTCVEAQGYDGSFPQLPSTLFFGQGLSTQAQSLLLWLVWLAILLLWSPVSSFWGWNWGQLTMPTCHLHGP